MLYLVGLGLWNEKDISLRGVEACKNCENVYAELYTAKWGGSLEKLGKVIGKKITLLKRSDLEEDSQKLVDGAKENNIAILVPGDPLFATTHLKIIQEAKELGIKVEVIHSSSIYTAVAESGLSIYSFGKTVTIPAPQENYKPTSFYDEIKKNKSIGLHTLVLLDIEMPVKEAIEILLKIDKENFLKERIVAISKMGSGERAIKYSTAENLLKENLPAPAVIIMPGKLNFIEEEFLEKI